MAEGNGSPEIPTAPPQSQPESGRGLVNQLRRRVPDWLRRRSALRGQAVTPPEQVIRQPARVDNPPADIGVSSIETALPIDLGRSVELLPIQVQPEEVGIPQAGSEVAGVASPDTETISTRPADQIVPVEQPKQIEIPEDLIRILRSANTWQEITDSLNIVEDTLPVREAAEALAFLTRENQTHVVSVFIGSAFDVMSAVLNRRRRVENQPLSLTTEETQAMADLFAALQERLPLLRQYNVVDAYLTPALHSFLNRNPELAAGATNLVREILRSANTWQEITASLNIVRDTLPVREAAGALALLARENQTRAASVYVDRSFDVMSAVLNRRRRVENQPLSLTTEETQAMADLFAALQERLPLLRQHNVVDAYLTPALHSFLNRNPELAGMAAELVQLVGKPPTETLVARVSRYAPQVPITEVASAIEAGEPRVREVTASIDRFNFLSEVLRGLSADQKQQILDGLSQYVQQDQGEERLLLLRTIFASDSSRNLGDALRNRSLNLNQLPQLLNDQAVINLVSVMLDRPTLYRFQLGTILSQIPLTNIPEALRVKLQPVITDSELKIKTEHGSWWLCGQAEPRLARSIANQAVVLANGQLLVKFDGKFSALCLNTFTTQEGQTFFAGNWYSPTDTETRTNLRGAFDHGIARVALQRGEWAIMRPLTDYGGKTAEQILAEARQFALRLSDRLPDVMEGMTRQDYRQMRREEG